MSDIPFPKLGKRSKIDVLIGSDHYNLLFPMEEVRGSDNEPSGRLCALGWTATGTFGTSEEHGASNTGYLNTYRIQRSECSDGDLNYLLKQFWSLEAIGITLQVEQPLSPEEKPEHYYMDDLMPSAPTVDDEEETRKQPTELGDLAGFHIRKWISNEPDVTADVAEGHRASDIDLERRELPTTTTLDVLWASRDDKFSFRHSLQLDEFEFTKRNVLRRTATFYDPSYHLM